MKIEWKKFQLIWCWGPCMYLINVFPFISACQGTGDCSSLKRWRNSVPWWRLGVFWLRAGWSLCWGIIKLSCFSKFLLALNSHHKTHSLQWDSIVAIPPAGGQLHLPSLCREARHKQELSWNAFPRSPVSRQSCSWNSQGSTLSFPAFIL